MQAIGSLLLVDLHWSLVGRACPGFRRTERDSSALLAHQLTVVDSPLRALICPIETGNVILHQHERVTKLP